MGICQTQSPTQAFSLTHGTFEELSSPRSYTVVTPHGNLQIRLAAAPPADAKTYMSQYTGLETEHSDPSNGIASPAQPLRLTNVPKPPLNHGLQSPQGEPPNPGNQRPPAKSENPAITSPQVQHQSKDSAASEPNQTQQRSARVQKLSQFTKRSINSDIQRTLGPTKEVRTRLGRLLRPPTHLNL